MPNFDRPRRVINNPEFAASRVAAAERQAARSVPTVSERAPVYVSPGEHVAFEARNAEALTAAKEKARKVLEESQLPKLDDFEEPKAERAA